MKRNFLCGLIASVSMISIGAYADPVPDASSAALTTKGYVDDGLKYVYKVASGISDGAVKSLQNIVGNAADPANNVEATGLVKRVTDLEKNNGYTAGTGVVVTPGENDDPSTIGIAVPSNATNGTKYVFQADGNGGGTWQAMEVESTWDPTFLTIP